MGCGSALKGERYVNYAAQSIASHEHQSHKQCSFKHRRCSCSLLGTDHSNNEPSPAMVGREHPLDYEWRTSFSPWDDVLKSFGGYRRWHSRRASNSLPCETGLSVPRGADLRKVLCCAAQTVALACRQEPRNWKSRRPGGDSW